MAHTKHGLHIPGSPEGKLPNVVKCGGYTTCRECVEEAYNWEPEPERNMAIDEDFITFVRKPFTVQAIEVTIENIHEISEFTGELREPPDEDPFIRVDKKRVPNVYNIHLGYWVTRMGHQVRAYNPDVFRTQFTEYDSDLEAYFTSKGILDDSAQART